MYWQASSNRCPAHSLPANVNSFALQTVLNKIGASHPFEWNTCYAAECEKKAKWHTHRQRERERETADGGSKVHIENHTNGTSNLDNSDIRRANNRNFLPNKITNFRAKWKCEVDYPSIHWLRLKMRYAMRRQRILSSANVCVFAFVCVTIVWKWVEERKEWKI